MFINRGGRLVLGGKDYNIYIYMYMWRDTCDWLKLFAQKIYLDPSWLKSPRNCGEWLIVNRWECHTKENNNRLDQLLTRMQEWPMPQSICSLILQMIALWIFVYICFGLDPTWVSWCSAKTCGEIMRNLYINSWIILDNRGFKGTLW